MAMIKEYGGKEAYASKGAMKKHEGKEGMKKEKSEGAGYKNGGKVMGGKAPAKGMGKGYAMGGKVLVKGKNC